MTSIAIMQPTFMPWIGYFAMIDRVDLFVYLDNVQFDKRSWQQRNQIKTSNGPALITVPVQSKGKRDQLIRDVQIQYEENPFDKILKTLQHSYSKAPHFNTYFPAIERIFQEKPMLLADLNEKIINFLCDEWGISKKFVKASTLDVDGAKADLLVDICQQCKADTYISPPGSKGYLDESDAFEKASIAVSYHEYTHPTYKQLYGEFSPYMSALDLLFNEGKDGAAILRKGVQ